MRIFFLSCAAAAVLYFGIWQTVAREAELHGATWLPTMFSRAMELSR